MHDVSHKGVGGELVRELSPEKPKGGIGGVDLLAVFKEDRRRDIFFLNGNKNFHAQAGDVSLLRLVHAGVRWAAYFERCQIATYWVARLRDCTDFVHCEQHRVVFVKAVSPAVVFENALQRYVRRIILD